MFPKAIYILTAALCLGLQSPEAQNITGTWEGQLGNKQFLQLNIIQVGDSLCGYSWDHLWSNHKDYCKAYFSGGYNKKEKRWYLKGSSFMEINGSHRFMELSFVQEKIRGKYKLWGKDISEEVDESITDSLFGNSRIQTMIVTKIADAPTLILNSMKDCLDSKRKADTTKNLQADTLILQPITRRQQLKRDNSILLKQMADRKNVEMTKLTVTEKNIVLNVYDNALIDGDTVSVFYNGHLILSHKLLSAKPLVIPILLDEKTTTHQITLFAENLGTIPPNTALVVIHAGAKRYELFASATLTENAVIMFEYKGE